jgi:hypothetical protein
MSDRFNEYIDKNREAFDDEVPGEGVWNAIRNRLPEKQKNYQWLWKAAAVIFFTSSVLLMTERFYNNNGNDISATEEVFNKSAGKEFNQVEDFYYREINQKRDLIQDLDEAGISAEAELQKLEAMYMVLKEQMKADPSEEVIEALTLNLIVRLDLLNQVVEEIEQKEAANNTKERAAKAEI